MSKFPFFTIAIPAYKGKFLREAIKSCLQQIYPHFELVIVNDASPESLDNIVNVFDDERIRYFRNQKNCGAVDVVDNWNKCLDYAKGEYIICMGDDDILLPHCLEEYVKLIGKYPGLGVYHAWTEIINEDSDIIGINERCHELESAFSFLYYRLCGRKMYIGDFCYDVKKLRKDGGFYKLPMAWGSDDITAFRAALSGGIAHTSNPSFQYRVNKKSISSSGDAKVKIQATLLYERWLDLMLLSQDGTQMVELDRLFLRLIKDNSTLFFNKRIAELIKKDLIATPSNLFYWIHHRNDYNLSSSRIIYIYIVAAKEKLLRRHY